MRKNLLRSIALSLLWLSVGIACKKEEVVASCEPSICCGQYTYRFVQDLNGVKADVGLVGFWFKQPIMNRRGIAAYINQWDMMDTYEQTSIPNDPNPPYKYRVWGKVYQS